MKEKEKLINARNQVQNLLKILKGNEFETYMNLKLASVYYEIERQILNLTSTNPYTKIEE